MKNDKINRLPERGLSHDDVLRELIELKSGDVDWHAGRCFSLVYHASDAHSAFLKQAHNLYFSENGLNPVAFASLHRMESDVMRMTASMLHGGPEACGTMTSGGTESLLLAIKTYRDWARKHRPHIRKPEVVLARTAHPAFDKACHYFDVTPRWVEVGSDFRIDVKKAKRAIGRNTILLVGSAPQYAHGVIDPIAELGELAVKHKLPLHVDACVGGFCLPFLEQLGVHVPRWDFRVPGVTSISADIHKYGYTSKGASTLTYRSMNHLRHQFFISTDFPGGVYLSPSLPGTRSGGAIAAAWAGMQAMGVAGYRELTQLAWDASQRLRRGISEISGLCLYDPGNTTIVTWGSADAMLDVYAVADQMQERGWYVDRQQHPSSVHLTVTANHVGVVDRYLEDLRASVAYARAHPELRSQGQAAMYGMMAKVPVRSMIRSTVEQLMEQMYGPDGGTVSLDAKPKGKVAQAIDAWVKSNQASVLMALDRIENLRARFSRGQRTKR